MKRLLLSTAILGAVSLPALAQDQTIFREAQDSMELRASDFLGMRVYATEADVGAGEFQGIQEGWEDIGGISDIVMNRDGDVQAVLVDIGGFLGIGARTVAVSMDALRFVSDSATAEEADDFFLVMNASREALESAPEYMDTQNEGMNAEQAAAQTDEVIEEGAANVVAAGAAAGAAVEGAVEETGEELAQAGAEVTDEVMDAGEEVTEEVAQTDMTDTQEDGAEIADANADAMEESAEEVAEVEAEMADEAADTTEMAAETTLTETEMATQETAEAATETTTTEGDVVVTTVGGDTAATMEEGATEEMAEAETVTVEEVAEAERTSAETVAREPLLREGFMAAGLEDITAARLEGAPVYDVNDERVGEVGEILMSTDGQVSQLVIDVGGFLGLGEKPVALELTSLDILRQDGGEEIRVYVSQTKEELESMDRFEMQ